MNKETKNTIDMLLNDAYGGVPRGYEDQHVWPMVDILYANTLVLAEIEERLAQLNNVLVELTNAQMPRRRVN